MKFRYIISSVILIGIIALLIWFLLPRDFKLPFSMMNMQSEGQLEPTLLGTKWQWIETRNSNNTIEKSENPEKFILVLNNGVYSSTTDCNTVQGSLKVDRNNLIFGYPAVSKKSCPDSLEDLYSSTFLLVDRYEIKNEHLFLTLRYNRAVMEFKKVN